MHGVISTPDVKKCQLSTDDRSVVVVVVVAAAAAAAVAVVVVLKYPEMSRFVLKKSCKIKKKIFT